jgi:hypothetical protein
MGERSGGFEAGNAWNCRVRSDVEENLVACQRACPAVIQAHLERFRSNKTPSLSGIGRLRLAHLRATSRYRWPSLIRKTTEILEYDSCYVQSRRLGA